MTWRDKAQNLSIFLNACRQLKVPEDSLFTVKDLKHNAVIPVARCLFALERRLDKQRKAEEREAREKQAEKLRKEEEARQRRLRREQQVRAERQARVSKESLTSASSLKAEDIEAGDEVVTKNVTTYDIEYDSADSQSQQGSLLSTDDDLDFSDDDMGNGSAEELVIERRSTRAGVKRRAQAQSERAELSIEDGVDAEEDDYASYDEEEKEKDEDLEYKEEKDADDEEGDRESLSESDLSVESEVEAEQEPSLAKEETPEDLYSSEEQREGNEEMFKILDEIFGSKSNERIDVEDSVNKEVETTTAKEETTKESPSLGDDAVPQTPKAVVPPRKFARYQKFCHLFSIMQVSLESKERIFASPSQFFLANE